MSHVAKVELKVTDLDDLAAACADVGCTFDRDATEWEWYGEWEQDYDSEDAAFRHGIAPERYGTSDAGVIRVPGASYEIGVYRLPDGTFGLVYDNFNKGRGIETHLGAGLPRLRQTYADRRTAKSFMELRAKGYTVQRRELEDGSVQYVAVQ